MPTDSSPEPGGLSLTSIDNRRSVDEKARDGKSGSETYHLTYYKETDTKTVEGKVTEVGQILEDGQQDLRPLADEGYTHYAEFRLNDRSTTIVVQDPNGDTFKAYVFGRNNARVAHPVEITAE